MFVGRIVRHVTTAVCKNIFEMNEDDAKAIGRVAQVCAWIVLLDVADMGSELFSTVGEEALTS